MTYLLVILGIIAAALGGFVAGVLYKSRFIAEIRAVVVGIDGMVQRISGLVQKLEAKI